MAKSLHFVHGSTLCLTRVPSWPVGKQVDLFANFGIRWVSPFAYRPTHWQTVEDRRWKSWTRNSALRRRQRWRTSYIETAVQMIPVKERRWSAESHGGPNPGSGNGGAALHDKRRIATTVEVIAKKKTGANKQTLKVQTRNFRNTTQFNLQASPAITCTPASLKRQHFRRTQLRSAVGEAGRMYWYDG